MLFSAWNRHAGGGADGGTGETIAGGHAIIPVPRAHDRGGGWLGRVRTVAAEIHGAVEAPGLAADGPIDVVGHDIGTWIGYAYAAEWPGDVKRLAVFDAALPGITPPPAAGIPSAQANLKTWHFAFNRLDDLPELLLRGRERAFLTWLFRAKAVRPWVIAESDLDEYERVNAAPARHGRPSPITGTSSDPKGWSTAARAPRASSPRRCSPSAPRPARAPPCWTPCASSRPTCAAACSRGAGTPARGGAPRRGRADPPLHEPMSAS